MWTWLVASRTPPPKHSRQETTILCLRLSVLSLELDIHFGNRPRQKGTTPVSTMVRTLDTVNDNIFATRLMPLPCLWDHMFWCTSNKVQFWFTRAEIGKCVSLWGTSFLVTSVKLVISAWSYEWHFLWFYTLFSYITQLFYYYTNISNIITVDILSYKNTGLVLEVHADCTVCCIGRVHNSCIKWGCIEFQVLQTVIFHTSNINFCSL